MTLISFGGDLECLGRLEKTRSAATKKDGVRCTDLVEIEPPVSVDELRAAMPTNVRGHVDYRTLPLRTGAQTLAALARLRPELAGAIRRLATDPSARARRGAGFDNVAMEKDAVGIAIEIFDGERSELARWSAVVEEAQPFLAGLPEAVLREDPMIVHDASVFGDWELVKRSAVGSVRFKRGERSLTIINVNRTAIETTLGVDLIYYNEYFDAFVLVQYKRMTDSGEAGWLYRPDSNHDAEVERMRGIPSVGADPLDALNYRLNPGACFFKLCESVVFDPDTAELLKGMYLPLEYVVACQDSAKGARGGSALGLLDCPAPSHQHIVRAARARWVDRFCRHRKSGAPSLRRSARAGR